MLVNNSALFGGGSVFVSNGTYCSSVELSTNTVVANNTAKYGADLASGALSLQILQPVSKAVTVASGSDLVIEARLVDCYNQSVVDPSVLVSVGLPRELVLLHVSYNTLVQSPSVSGLLQYRISLAVSSFGTLYHPYQVEFKWGKCVE